MPHEFTLEFTHTVKSEVIVQADALAEATHLAIRLLEQQPSRKITAYALDFDLVDWKGGPE